MDSQENLKSEIAQFLRRWDEEVDAMLQGLNGYTITARHDFISHRTKIFGDANMQELMTLVARQEAQSMTASSDNPT